MKKYFLIFLILCSVKGFCQLQIPDAASDLTKAVCSPGIINKSRSRGIDFSFTRLGGGPIQSESNSSLVPSGISSVTELTLKLKLPLMNKPDFKLLLGLSYQPETFFFETPDLLKANSVFNTVHAARLKSSGIGLYAIKSINGSQYTALRMKVNYNGDYDALINFDKRYRAISATWAYGYKISDNFEWGFGVSFNSNFRRTLALPFIFYNKNFNDKWGIESIFPGYIQLRHNVNAKTIILGGYRFNSRNYSLDKNPGGLSDPIIYHLNHSEIQFGITIERQLVPWVWASLKGGYQYNFNTRLESQDLEFPSFRVRPPHAPYLTLGLFVSPHMKH